MKKRVWALLLCLCLAVGALPSVAVAGDNYETYTYRVIYNYNGGMGMVKDDNTYTNGSAVTLQFDPRPTRDGYTFLGWDKTATAKDATYTQSGTITFTITDDTTLYAVWSTKTYTVTFDAGEGGGWTDETGKTSQTKTVTANHGSSIAADKVPTAPSKEHYDFKGWLTKDGTEFSFSQAITSNITLTAKWEPTVYTVTFDANGGKGTMDPMTGTIENKIILPTSRFTHDDYVFTGWNTKADGSGKSYTAGQSVAANLTLYAQWAEKSATGSLTITKLVTGEGVDKAKEFTFTVSVTNGQTPIEGRYGSTSFENGSASFTLKHGGNVTIAGLPVGAVYTVSEAEDEAYTSASTNAEGIIRESETIVAFTNTLKAAPSEDPTPTDTPAPNEQPFDNVPLTGDGSRIELWAALAALSLLGVAALMRAQKRSR